QSSRKIFLIPEQKAEGRRQNPPLTPPRRGNGGRGQEAEPTPNPSQEGNRRQEAEGKEQGCKVEVKGKFLAEHDITPDNPSILLNGRGHLPVQSEASFKSSVISALKSIHTHQLSKIVLANAIDVVSPRQFKLVNSLDSLRQNYPDCYIFSISNGKGQNFIGASPECLVSIQNRQLVTDAIAGSAPRGKTAAEDADLAHRLLCSEKERREHRFVLDFIIKCLSELGLNPQVELTNQLLQLSNIQHLWTPIKAQLLKDIHPLEIVAKLHPTPAVAGVPTKMAQEQILALETFDRSLYAAPLGWVDYQGNCEFIVGIRSALIESTQPLSESWQTCRARLYAGAGIVAGSDPNKELAEIQLKFQALLKTLL
ncbi:MAG: isochorismate synthase, partial [Symploca sp. SIO2D2]|nr:isochorismate synthase [Symploca sp. SIO2D2]